MHQGIDRLPSGRYPFAPTRSNGGVAKWSKAAVCKTVIRGFESRLRLQSKTLIYKGLRRFLTC